MTTAHRLNARLDDELARKLAELEKRSGKSATEIVRAALNRYYDEEVAAESPAAALEAAGLIGCISAPANLSTSYKAELGRSLSKKHGR